MRGSGWLLPLAATILWLAAVAWPMIAAATELSAAETGTAAIRPAGELLSTTVVWSSVVALGATILGWAPGRWLGRLAARPDRRGRRRFFLLAVLLLAPICLPSYLAFWAWWQAWPPDSAIYRWAVEHGQVATMRHATLGLGLLCWSWPLAAWCVAAWVAAIPAEHDEMLHLDGAGRWTRGVDCLRTDASGLACGAFIVFMATFNNTTSFDLAEVFTFANELRAVQALGGTTRDLLIAGMPAAAVAAVGALATWWALNRRRSDDVSRALSPAWATIILSSVIWLLSVAAPLALVSGGALRRARVAEFGELYGRALADTIMVAAACGALAAIVACGLALMWQDRRRWIRVAAHVQAVGWLLAALIPATLVAAAHESAYNRGPLADFVYRSPRMLVLGHLSVFGFVAALLGRWAAQREPAIVHDLRLLDGADTLRGQLIAAGPTLLSAAVATAAITAVLSLSEIALSGQLAPAGFELLAPIVLNALHYQRPETVALATVATIGLALVAVLAAALAWTTLRRFSTTGLDRTTATGLLVSLALMGGCNDKDGDDSRQPFDTVMTFGVNGLSLGQFSYPRAIAVDPQRGLVYVVDKTARVQRFGLEGKPQLEWSMPEKEQGKPTGISVAPDGRVLIADTHYFRVIIYDSEGRELQRFGSYGTEPGQFIYPTDIAIGPGGSIYVSEYGGNDRVQVFSPPPECEFLFTFGSPGDGQDQFTRPQSLAFSRDLSELYIADAINHRIVVTDPQGRWLRTFGGPGREPGWLNYPYGLAVLDDGSLLVAEFGGNRIQRFSPEGRSLGTYGRLGTNPGELRYPWAVASAGDLVFILDSGNNRVQVINSPQ
jgi:DNA-binding beta-propeller fold protein YncE